MAGLGPHRQHASISPRRVPRLRNVRGGGGRPLPASLPRSCRRLLYIAGVGATVPFAITAGDWLTHFVH